MKPLNIQHVVTGEIVYDVLSFLQGEHIEHHGIGYYFKRDAHRGAITYFNSNDWEVIK